MLRSVNHHGTMEQADLRPILTAPFREWTAEALLRHVQTRTTVHYFSVPDVVETARPRIDKILSNYFEFNQEEHQLPPTIPWLTNPSQDREWLILLHKFYYAVGLGMAYHETGQSRYAEKWVALTNSWIETVPLAFLPSDVAGRRIQNWIFAHSYFVNTTLPSCLTPEFYSSFLRSLHWQVSYLRDHVTPARNHRTLELCAIFLAAVVFPEFAESHEWLTWSRDELVKNIHTDLLPDGVHCEQSTDYHHLVLKNYLWIRKLALLNQVEMPKEFDALVRKALDFSLYAHRPDGLIPALSDGDSRCFLDLLQQGYNLYGGEALLYGASRGKQGQPPAARSLGFPHSGYYVLRSGWGDHGEPYQDERYLIFDCGPLGIGNHGHLDLLSFEAYAYGTPLIMDPGRYTYDESGPVNWRVRFRGTAAHNTVLIDGQNQTRYEWKKTRFKIVGPEPDRSVDEFISTPGLDYLRGTATSHEYPVAHERTILFINGEYWVILDLLRAQERHHYDLLFHLSPAAQEQVSITRSQDTVSIHSPQLLLAHPLVPTVHPTIEEGFISTAYGTKACAPIIQLTQEASNACFFTVLYPYHGSQPTISIEVPRSEEAFKHLHNGHGATVSITVIHDEEDSYRDDLTFTPQTVPGTNTLAPPETSHMCVSRTNSAGRLIFRYQA